MNKGSQWSDRRVTGSVVCVCVYVAYLMSWRQRRGHCVEAANMMCGLLFLIWFVSSTACSFDC